MRDVSLFRGVGVYRPEDTTAAAERSLVVIKTDEIDKDAGGRMTFLHSATRYVSVVPTAFPAPGDRSLDRYLQ